MSMPLVKSGSPYRRTAWLPMTMYGISALLSAVAIFSSRRSNIDHLGQANVDLDSFERILEREHPEGSSLPVQGLKDLSIAEIIWVGSTEKRVLEVFDQLRVL